MRNNYYSRNNNRGYKKQNNYNKSGFKFRKQKIEKPLDPSLFIKSAKEQATEEYHSNAKFSDYKFEDKILRNIYDHGYITPTLIQEKSIPQILLGRDLIGIANTGTGKTAAFLLTLINKVFLDRSQRVLIVAPTRELAVQITNEFRIFAKGTELEAVVLIGGSNIKRQSYALKHRPHFVIGTPGRIKDLAERKELNLFLYQNVVLDEVDRMVDIGFLKDVKQIISYLPKKRHSLFFSATVDKKTEEILKNFVTNPVTVTARIQNTAENIEQDIVRIKDGRNKIDVLHDILIQPGFDKVIVFGKTKWGMEKLSRSLTERGFKTAAIHGNKSQNQRQRALQDFKDNRLQILIATDIASRGIDIDDVTHVINYDAPTTYEDYIHRIGRTGRAGKRGSALTFVE